MGNVLVNDADVTDVRPLSVVCMPRVESDLPSACPMTLFNYDIFNVLELRKYLNVCAQYLLVTWHESVNDITNWVFGFEF